MTEVKYGIASNGKAVHAIGEDGRAKCPDTKHPGNHYTILKVLEYWDPDHELTCDKCQKIVKAEKAMQECLLKKQQQLPIGGRNGE